LRFALTYLINVALTTPTKIALFHYVLLICEKTQKKFEITSMDNTMRKVGMGFPSTPKLACYLVWFSTPSFGVRKQE